MCDRLHKSTTTGCTGAERLHQLSCCGNLSVGPIALPTPIGRSVPFASRLLSPPFHLHTRLAGTEFETISQTEGLSRIHGHGHVARRMSTPCPDALTSTNRLHVGSTTHASASRGLSN
jgi:hypothetical protein